MRIVAGTFRGKPLLAPAGRDSARPTSDRARESVFNILMHNHFGSLDGLVVADLFAGTGALGLEALSRGAAQAIFVEQGCPALEALRANIAACQAQKVARVISSDATALPSAPAAQGCGLVFLDPPYDSDLLIPALRSLTGQRWLAAGAIVVCETRFSTDFESPEGYEVLDERRYGKAKVTFLRFAGQ